MPLSQELLKDKFRGAILGCFLGDAFGAGFEGMPPDRASFHLNNLEDGPRGHSFAKTLADRLFETWWKDHQTPSG